MTRLTTENKSRKKQSEFQKLWAKAEKLKRKNARLRDRMDEIIRRIRTDIDPVEKETTRQQIPLLKRLLTLGQRKSLTQWERQTLDDWIREILELLQSAGHLNDVIVEEISRYDAFRIGIELDETSSTPLPDQLRAHFEHEEILLQEEDEAEDEAWRKKIDREIEKILDQTFGTEPPRPEHRCQNVDDFFQDELKEEQQRQYEAYIKSRNAARKELLEEMLAETGFSEDDEDEEDECFDFDFDPFGSNAPHTEQDDDDTPAISNVVFRRLFRSAAAQLHPDREHDPDIREKKHTLMTRLLNARKQGDVMTIVQMYQEHVGEDAALSKTDEKQLIKALKRQVDELGCEQEEYSFESPVHQLAYERFYFHSPRKTDQAFKQHIQKMKKAASDARSLALNIKSLKALKPHLERRHDEYRFINPLEALDAFFDFTR